MTFLFPSELFSKANGMRVTLRESQFSVISWNRTTTKYELVYCSCGFQGSESRNYGHLKRSLHYELLEECKATCELASNLKMIHLEGWMSIAEWI